MNIMFRLLLLLFCMAAIFPGHAQSREETLRTAKEYVSRKLYPDAMVLLDQLIFKNPDDPQALWERANLYELTNERAAAIRDLIHLRSATPYNDTVMTNLGVLFEHSGFLDSALTCYKLCLQHARTRRDSFSANINIGSVYNYQQNYAKAVSHYIRMQKLFPDSLAVLTNLAQSYADNGQKDKAATMMQEIVRRNEHYQGAYNNLGMLYSQMGKYPEAKQAFQRGLSICDTADEGYFAILNNNYGYLLYCMKDYKHAIQYINKSIMLYPTNSYAFRNRALVHIEESQVNEACEDLARSTELGFKMYYGKEVEELQAKYCKK